jgi:uncharacterized protein YdhG (YjbR/CyaY superfamily)
VEVEVYINSFQAEVRQRLLAIRKLVISTVPQAEEKMAYGLVGYYFKKKPLLYFGGFKKHIGIYATPNEQLVSQLSNYIQGKGSVQFPHNQPIPFDLILSMIKLNILKIDKNAVHE